MMINDLATTVVEMDDETGFAVVESLGAPCISELSFSEFQDIANFQPSLFGKDATAAHTTKCRGTNGSVERVNSVNIATPQDISSVVQTG